MTSPRTLIEHLGIWADKIIKLDGAYFIDGKSGSSQICWAKDAAIAILEARDVLAKAEQDREQMMRGQESPKTVSCEHVRQGDSMVVRLHMCHACIERIEGYERTSAQPAPHARPDDWNAALEEAAKVCEEHAQRALAAGSLIDPITLARESAAEGCADEIRALKRECEGEVKIGKEADDDFYL